MEAIVLAGGFGTRLKAVVADVPKPMAPVAGKPFLEILLTAMAEKGFKRVVLSLGHMADTIVTHFGDRFAGMTLVYAVEDVPLGTGGAVRLACEQCQADHVFVFNGDTYLDLEVNQVEAQWQRNRAPIIVARAVEDVSRYGSLSVDSGKVTGFAEKGAVGPGLINAGCYVLPASALNAFASGVPFSLENDFLAPAVSANPFDVFVTEGHFIDIGIPADYARAQLELKHVCQ